VGVSNSDLDMSKMSRLLVLRRPGLSKEELRESAIEISKRNFNAQVMNFDHSLIETSLSSLSDTYFEFINKWKQNSSSRAMKDFYGLRDFYNLIRTLNDLMKASEGTAINV
jgi:hypothetical protein